MGSSARLKARKSKSEASRASVRDWEETTGGRVVITEIINPTTGYLLLSATIWYCLLLFVMTKMNNLTSGHNCPCCPHRWQVWRELTKDQAKYFQSHCLCSCSKGSPIDDIAGVHHTVKELFDNNLNHLERAGFLQKGRFATTIFSSSND